MVTSKALVEVAARGSVDPKTARLAHDEIALVIDRATNAQWRLSAVEDAQFRAAPNAIPANVSLGEFKDAEWREMWLAARLVVITDWAYDTPTERLDWGEYNVDEDGVLRVGIGNGAISVYAKPTSWVKDPVKGLSVFGTPTLSSPDAQPIMLDGVIMLPIRGGAAGVGTTTASNGTTTSTSIGWSHNNNGNVVVVTGFAGGAFGSGGSTVYPCDYGGIPGTVIVDQADTGVNRTALFVVPNNAPTGANTTTLRTATSVPLGGTAVSVTGADTLGRWRDSDSQASASASSSTLTLTTDADDLLADALLTLNLSASTIGANQSLAGSINVSAGAFHDSSTQDGADGGAMSWTFSANEFAHAAASFYASGTQTGVVHDIASKSATSASVATVSWTHTPVGTPKGAWVIPVTYATATDKLTGVTYGGVAMTRVPGGAATDTATELGRVDLFFLGSGIPTGAQTIEVTRTNDATVMLAYAGTVTETNGYNTDAVGIVLIQENATYAEQNVTDSSPGTSSLRVAVGYTGAANPGRAGTNSIMVGTDDQGAFGSMAAVERTNGQGSRPVGFVVGTDDAAAVHFAIKGIAAVTSLPPRSVTINQAVNRASTY